MLITNFSVGPSELFPGVKEFLCESILDDSIIMPHRSPKFSALYSQVEINFKDFFKIPEGYTVFFTYSATDGMDILINAVVDDNITHITNGVFGNLFINSSKYLGKNPEIIINPDSYRVNLENITTKNNIITITSNDTSTGMMYSNQELVNFRKNNSKKTIFIDATSSFGAIEYEINSADGWILSVQKNLGLPSGLGILIVKNTLIEQTTLKEKDGKNIGGHNSLLKLDNFHKTYHTPATPNTLLISGVGFIANKYKEVFGNITKLDTFTKQKAEYFYGEIEKIDGISVYNSGEGKSLTTFVLSIREEKLTIISDKLSQNDYSFSPGLFELQGKVIRIANFPVHKMRDFEALIELLK